MTKALVQSTSKNESGDDFKRKNDSNSKQTSFHNFKSVTRDPPLSPALFDPPRPSWKPFCFPWAPTQTVGTDKAVPAVLLDDVDFSEEHRFIDLQLQIPVWEAQTFLAHLEVY